MKPILCNCRTLWLCFNVGWRFLQKGCTVSKLTDIYHNNSINLTRVCWLAAAQCRACKYFDNVWGWQILCVVFSFLVWRSPEASASHLRYICNPGGSSYSQLKIALRSLNIFRKYDCFDCLQQFLTSAINYNQEVSKDFLNQITPGNFQNIKCI